MGSWLVAFANVYLVTYGADALVSVLDELLAGPDGLGLRGGLAAFATLLSLVMLCVLAATPRLPLGLFLPLCLSVLWLNLGAAPLPLLLPDLEAFGRAAAGLQLLFAGLAFADVYRRTGRRSVLFPPGMLAGRPFSWRHSLLCLGGYGLVLIPALLLYVPVAVATFIQVATQGFVSFDTTGVSLADRQYVRDDRAIRLVGMMHIGERAAYEELVASFVAPSTVILTEGVTDEARILEVPLSYGKAAAALGLESQGSIEEYLGAVPVEDGAASTSSPLIRHADVDLSDFSPVTLDWLNWVSEIFDSESPSSAVLAILQRPTTPEELEAVQHDILERRNEHLLGEIAEALPEFEQLIVPWGALHLPAIEAALLADGFEPDGGSTRRLITWRRLLDRADEDSVDVAEGA